MPRSAIRPRPSGPSANNPSGRRKDGSLPKSAFQPGRSGNPTGRPKDLPSFRAMVRELGTGPAMECLLRAVEQDDTKAAEILLAYGWGKPTQQLEVTGAGGGPLEVTDARDRLAARLAALLAARDGSGSGSGDAAP